MIYMIVNRDMGLSNDNCRINKGARGGSYSIIAYI